MARIFSRKIESVPGYSPVIRSSFAAAQEDVLEFRQDLARTSARACARHRRRRPLENNCSRRRITSSERKDRFARRDGKALARLGILQLGIQFVASYLLGYLSIDDAEVTVRCSCAAVRTTFDFVIAVYVNSRLILTEGINPTPDAALASRFPL